MSNSSSDQEDNDVDNDVVDEKKNTQTIIRHGDACKKNNYLTVMDDSSGSLPTKWCSMCGHWRSGDTGCRKCHKEWPPT